MTAEDFNAWIAHMGLNVSTAAKALDLSRNSVMKYQREGAPGYIGFACAAIAFGLPAWKKGA